MLSYELLNKISGEYGDSFYLLDCEMIKNNYNELLEAFQSRYENTKIAYSYKTNYTPKICKMIDELGGAAEVVSEMELWLAIELGVIPNEIYYNGPYKKYQYLEESLLKGVHINLDADYELDMVRDIANKYPEKQFEIGLRCNVDIGQEIPSRFGFDVDSGNLERAIECISQIVNVEVTGLHCHIPFRNLESYKKRVERMNKILDKISVSKLSYISMGGGYMGKIDEKMLSQFEFAPPTFENYAEVVAGFMRKRYGNIEGSPTLIIEPGSALVANSMKYVTKVLNIKQARNLKIASLSGSIFQMNPSVKDMNRPIEIYQTPENAREEKMFENLYMAGYTCIESDYLYKGYQGKLGTGDYVVFCNVGSYSVVMKPPFILSDIPMLEIVDGSDIKVWKMAQSSEKIFELFIK